MTKACTKCGQTKPVDDFSKAPERKDGRRSHCKQCTCDSAKAWRLANPEKAKEKDARSREKHREARLAREREYREKNREKRNAESREYHRKNRGKRLEQMAAWRAVPENAERLRIASAKWEQANPERYKAILVRCRHRRRARARKAFVEDLDMVALVLRDEGRCGICGDPLTGPDFHVDHVVPLAKGGLHMMANVQLAHPRCNWRKQDRIAWTPIAS